MHPGGTTVTVFPPAVPGERPELPYRPANWHEVFVSAALCLAGILTLSGGKPALSGSVNQHHVFLLVINGMIAIGGGLIVAGAILRRRTGSLWGLSLEIVGLALSAGIELANGLFSVATNPWHNYTSYLLLFALAGANVFRVIDIRADLRAGRVAAPR